MEDVSDDEQLIERSEKAKRPAKKSSYDKAALLSSGDEEEEDEQYTGEIIHSVNCDEGDSVSGSDGEVTAYTGEQETYIGDSNNNIDQVGISDEEEHSSHIKISCVKEGTLIKINDNDVVDSIPDEDEEVIEDNSAPPCLPTNDNISEIANKLKETNLSGAVLPRDNQEYLENMGFRESGSSCGYNSNENGSYSSSCETSKTRIIDNLKKERRKKLRKKSGVTEREENIKNTEITNSNGDYNSVPVNGCIVENGFSRDRASSKSSVSHSDSDNKVKQKTIIPLHKTSSNVSGEESDKSMKKSKVVNKKRNRTRHKVYLDDPDVHQLINEHVVLLKRFMETVHSGKFTKSIEENHEQDQSLPDVVFAGTALKSYNGQSFSVSPYGSHKSRGKDMISRIRSDSIPYSDDDEDEMFNNRDTYADQKNKISSNKENSQLYDICPDCGERHPPDELIDEAEICPDCGVQHNPYQHTPSAHKPWNKYMDSCRKSLIPGKRYQQVSTEQDPHDVVEDPLPSIEGPHTVDELSEGVRYNMKYLGSSQIISQHPINKETRMQQAQDAYNRMKGEDNEDEEAVTNVDMQISLERIKILNQETKFEDVMMDHALRTVCFICDMGNILVLMARRLTSDSSTDFSVEKGKPVSLGNIVGDREKKTSKNICHVFETEDAQKIAKAIGQAFNIAYRNFLQSNGISHEHVEEAEYCHVLESQKLVGADLDRLTDESASKEIVLNKKAGEALGIMLLESGWGSMLPTVFVAHIANYSVAARCQQLTVGDHILSCNGSSFVGMSLSECNNILKNTRSSNHVALNIVSCPPVVDVVISRPDVKYQLGFSVQNGTICSLLRGGIAERGGVRVGHRIIEINGDSVVAKTHQYIVDLLANTIGSIGMKTMPIAMYRLMVGDDQPQHM